MQFCFSLLLNYLKLVISDRDVTTCTCYMIEEPPSLDYYGSHDIFFLNKYYV